MHMDPEQPVPGVGDGLMLAELPAEAIDALMTSRAQPQRRRSCRSSCGTSGGELGRARPEAARCGRRRRVRPVRGGFAPTPELVDGRRARPGRSAPLAPLGGRPYATSTSRNPAAIRASFWDADAYQRLRRVKAAVDPET